MTGSGSHVLNDSYSLPENGKPTHVLGELHCVFDDLPSESTFNTHFSWLRITKLILRARIRAWKTRKQQPWL